MGFIGNIVNAYKEKQRINAARKRLKEKLNSPYFCGVVSSSFKLLDDRLPLYLNIENGRGVIYGENDRRYVFSRGDIISFNVISNIQCTIKKGKKTMAALRFAMEFADKSTVEADIISEMLPEFMLTLGLL